MPVLEAADVLELVAQFVQVVEAEAYGPFEAPARRRLSRRDEDDWPVLAGA